MNTKTAEEILNRIKHSNAVILESVYHSWDDLTTEQQNDLWPFVLKEYAEEYASPLKKRIEELEKALEHAKSILLIEKYAVAAKEIDVILNPSTNGK